MRGCLLGVDGHAAHYQLLSLLANAVCTLAQPASSSQHGMLWILYRSVLICLAVNEVAWHSEGKSLTPVLYTRHLMDAPAAWFDFPWVLACVGYDRVRSGPVADVSWVAAVGPALHLRPPRRRNHLL